MTTGLLTALKPWKEWDSTVEGFFIVVVVSHQEDLDCKSAVDLYLQHVGEVAPEPVATPYLSEP